MFRSTLTTAYIGSALGALNNTINHTAPTLAYDEGDHQFGIFEQVTAVFFGLCLLMGTCGALLYMRKSNQIVRAREPKEETALDLETLDPQDLLEREVLMNIAAAGEENEEKACKINTL